MIIWDADQKVPPSIAKIVAAVKLIVVFEEWGQLVFEFCIFIKGMVY